MAIRWATRQRRIYRRADDEVMEPADSRVMCRCTMAIDLAYRRVPQSNDLRAHRFDFTLESLEVCTHRKRHLAGICRGGAPTCTQTGKPIKRNTSIGNRLLGAGGSPKKVAETWFTRGDAARSRVW